MSTKINIQNAKVVAPNEVLRSIGESFVVVDIVTEGATATVFLNSEEQAQEFADAFRDAVYVLRQARYDAEFEVKYRKTVNA